MGWVKVEGVVQVVFRSELLEFPSAAHSGSPIMTLRRKESKNIKTPRIRQLKVANRPFCKCFRFLCQNIVFGNFNIADRAKTSPSPGSFLQTFGNGCSTNCGHSTLEFNWKCLRCLLNNNQQKPIALHEWPPCGFSMVHHFVRPHHALSVVAVLMLLPAQQEQHLARVSATYLKRHSWRGAFRVCVFSPDKSCWIRRKHGFYEMIDVTMCHQNCSAVDRDWLPQPAQNKKWFLPANSGNRQLPFWFLSPQFVRTISWTHVSAYEVRIAYYALSDKLKCN